MRIRNTLAAAVVAAVIFLSMLTTLTAQEPPADTAAPPRWHIEGDFAVLTWPAAGPAASYEVQHSPYGTAHCAVPNRCETVARDLKDTEYRQRVTMGHPPGRKDHFWVSVCNPAGCRTPVRAQFDDRRPAGSPQSNARRIAGAVEVEWTQVAGADHYTVWHSTGTPVCNAYARLKPTGCQPLATGVTGTSHSHEAADPSRNRYWVTACNAAGCTTPVGPGASTKGLTQQEPPQATAIPENRPAVNALNLTPSTVHTGDTLIATLTRPNTTNRPEKVRLSVSVPTGWSVARHQQDALCSPGECARTQTLRPGQTAQLTAHLSPSEPGRGTIRATVTHLEPDGPPRSATLTASANVIRAPAPGQPATPLLPPPQPQENNVPPLPLLLGAAALAVLALAGAALLYGRRPERP